MTPPTRPQPPLIDDGYLIKPEPIEPPPYQARRVGGCLMTLAILTTIAVLAAPRGGSYPTIVVPRDMSGLHADASAASRPGAPHGPLSETVDPVDAVERPPQPAGGIGTALIGGWATWFDDGPGLYAAVSWWRFGDAPYPVRICTGGSQCVVATVRDFCRCAPRHGKPTIIDLSPAAMKAIEPDYRRLGVVLVSIEWPLDALPATDGAP